MRDKPGQGIPRKYYPELLALEKLFEQDYNVWQGGAGGHFNIQCRFAGDWFETDV